MEAALAKIVDAIPGDVVSLCRRLRSHGRRGWVVGGCVRDLLRGVVAADWDVATDARPGEVRRIFGKVVPTGIKHGTVTVLLHGRPYEVTTLRGEGAYLDGRRPDKVEFIDDIVRDLARRDFTFNAIAVDPIDGELVDPFGGREDLAAHMVRAVGNPLERFGEDGLRVLRACRFAATLECTVEASTLQAMGDQRSLDTFSKVSAERVHDEWLKTMKARRPSVAFELMNRTGLLARISPELAATVGCPQGDDDLDVWAHSLQTLDACDADPVLRLAALVHDVGKPATLQRSGDGVTFPDHDRIGAELAEGLLSRLKFSNEHRKRVVHLVRQHWVRYEPGWTDAEVRRFVRRVEPDMLDDLLALARAGARARRRADELERLDELAARACTALAAKMALSPRDLALDGRSLMEELGLPPSPLVGELLAGLLELVTDDPERNQRDELLSAARRLLSERGAHS